jgi:hypothetical protein
VRIEDSLGHAWAVALSGRSSKEASKEQSVINLMLLSKKNGIQASLS